MTQHVTGYTRITNKTRSAKDHKISSMRTIKLPDHQSIITSWGVKKTIERKTNEKCIEKDNKRVHYKISSVEIKKKVDWLNWNLKNKNSDLNQIHI